MALLLLLAGCVADLGGADAVERRATDVLLDRLRVLGVRAAPSVPAWGEPFALTALALGPAEVTGWRVEACGWEAPRPLREVTCFGMPELVDPVGDRLPLPLVRAPWSAFPPAACDDAEAWPEDTATGAPSLPPDCAGPLHLRVTARDGAAEDAAVVTLLTVDPAWPRTGEPGEVTLDAPGAARPGDEVALVATLPLEEGWTPRTSDDVVARWTTDAGTFLGTGRTTGVVEDGVWRTVNTLRLPDDAEGPLRVAVVVDLSADVLGGRPGWSQRVTHQRWDVRALEVR